MGYFEDRDFSNVPTIPEYFKDKSIFITGGTGFMGKILIEKLLYSCTDLKKIYLLLRSKKGVTPADRLVQLYSIPCFDRLRKERPGVFEKKVSLLSGDILEDELGLSNDDKEILINEVNIVFHVAASVRFDDPLKFAVKLNLCGALKIMNLAKEMKNLSSLVHVSTSYSNSHRDPIEEVMYPPLTNWKELIDIVDKMDEHTLRVLTSKILGELPNTYTFTKQLAEHAVQEYQGILPIVIYRPSIVISSSHEPMPGWIDNFNGPVGLLVASGAGILRSVYADCNNKSDYIPVDMSVQGLIAAAWVRGTKILEPMDDIEIYNSCSGKLFEISTGDIIETGRQIIEEYPMEHTLWYYGGDMTSYKCYYYCQIYIFQLFPAIFVDLLLKVMGKKPMLIKIQRRIFNAMYALQYYYQRQWTFCNKNFLSLRSTIKEEDRQQFYYDLEGIDSMEHLIKSLLGAKQYLLKEKLENLPKARRYYRILKYMDRLVKITASYCFVSWIYNMDVVKTSVDQLYESIF